jgi:cell division protein FtsZ
MLQERPSIPGINYVCVNTDIKSLAKAPEGTNVIFIGERLTHGLGAGGDPAVGAAAAESGHEALEKAVKNSDLVFLTVGMGGGTGTGAAPILSQVVKETGALTVGVVTTPFAFEGVRRNRTAEEGIEHMKQRVDTLLVIPNERLHVICEEEITAGNAFKMADDVLRLGVQSIAELVTVPGEINLDFADVQSVMRDAGPAWMSIGWGTGEGRAKEAAQQAISNPLLDASIEGATGVLFNIAGGSDLKLSELHEAAEVIQRVVDPDANIIFGMVTDLKMENEIKLTVIATGFPTSETIQDRDDHLQEILAEALSGENSEIDLPPFLRRVSKYRRDGRKKLVAS